jgi:hypothetical protein
LVCGDVLFTSQNLGHENVLTTFSSYGDVGRQRQAEIIRSLGIPEQNAGVEPDPVEAACVGPADPRS